MKKYIVALGLFILFASSSLAHAAVIQYDFNGKFDSGNRFAANQEFSGSFSLDTSSIIPLPGPPGHGVSLSPAQVTVVVNGLTYTGQNIFPTQKLQYNTSATFYTYSPASVGMSFTSSNGVSGDNGVQTYKESVTFSGAFVPGAGSTGSSIYGLYNYEFTNRITGASQIGSQDFHGVITSYTEKPATTPIPGAIWLLGTGVAGLFGLRKKFKA